MEIELPSDLNDILTKLKIFTSTVSSLMSQVAQLKTLKWELPTEFLTLPSQVSLVHAKLQTLDTLLSPTTASPAKEEKNTNPTTKDAESTNLYDELVDLLGKDIVTQYYNKKLLYDKYYDKMLKRRKSSKIINCDVLTQKGPITLQVYREDGTIEVIPNIKVSDLHLAEWKEKIGKYLDFSLCSRSKTEEGLCKELQFSLVDNSKLNVVYLLNRSLKRFVSLLEGLKGGKKIALCQKE
ncbi:hypothetical protein Tco_0308552 [Tanacetum coccineum]